MITLVNKTDILFGIVRPPPKLPHGWSLIESEDDFVMAKSPSPESKPWWVGKKKLTRVGRGGDEKDKSNGKIKKGEFYFDDTETIAL